MSRSLLFIIFFLLIGSQPCLAAEQVVSVENFALALGKSGETGCLPRPFATEQLTQIAEKALKDIESDAQFVAFFSADLPSCPELYYVPIANDVRGIGYQHHHDEELFDKSPESNLEGLLWLNDLPYWEAYPEELERTFLHELGHRWSGRVHVARDDFKLLLGRDELHWNYFLETEASPLEGNAFSITKEGWSTQTHSQPTAYSSLDLYLMGLLPQEKVKPLRVLECEGEACLSEDCFGVTLSTSSPPQTCDALAFQGSERVLTISDIIAAEGERSPRAVSKSRRVSMLYLILAPSLAFFTEESCRTWKARIEQLTALVAERSGGRLSLKNISDQKGGLSCTELFSSDASEPENAQGCSWKNQSEEKNIWLLILPIVSGFCLLRRRRTSQ